MIGITPGLERKGENLVEKRGAAEGSTASMEVETLLGILLVVEVKRIVQMSRERESEMKIGNQIPPGCIRDNIMTKGSWKSKY